MSALGNSLRRRLALSKDTRFNTFIGGIGNNITTASQLASLLLIPLSTIRNFKIRNNDISCFITDSYSLPSAFAGSGNQNITGNIWALIDLQGKVNNVLNSSFFITNQTLDRLRFVYLPNAQVGNEAFRNRGFFNRLTIAIQNSVPVGSTTGNNAVFANAENNNQGAINFKVYTDVINQTNNNGNPDGDIQLLINQGSEVVYVPSVKVNPPTPTNIQQTQVGGTYAELDFTLPTHVNNYLGYFIIANGFYIAFIEEITNFYALGLNPSFSNRVELRLVDEFFNISEPIRISVLTPALPALFQNAVAYFKLDETSGNSIDVINGNLGRVFGGVTQGVSGKIGTAYSFDGINGRVDLDLSIYNSFNNDNYTISFWFKTNDVTKTQVLISDFNGTSFPARKLTALISGASQTVNFSFGDNGGNQTIASSVISNNVFYFVVLKYDINGVAELKLNNVSQGTHTFVNAPQNQNLITLGQRKPFPNFPLDGVIDELLFNNGQTTSQQDSELYNNGNGTTIN